MESRVEVGPESLPEDRLRVGLGQIGDILLRPFENFCWVAIVVSLEEDLRRTEDRVIMQRRIAVDEVHLALGNTTLHARRRVDHNRFLGHTERALMVSLSVAARIVHVDFCLKQRCENNVLQPSTHLTGLLA